MYMVNKKTFSWARSETNILGLHNHNCPILYVVGLIYCLPVQ